MTDPTDNSSVPILLAISCAVVLVAGGGWFLLGQDSGSSQDSVRQAPPLLESEAAVADGEPAGPDVDADLRKARLAADADILAFPAQQSALYFYGRIVSAEPDHDVANAELDAVIGRLSRTVTAHMAAEEYPDAYRLSVAVAALRPDHPLVTDVQQTLDGLAENYVDEAIQRARNGQDDAAGAALAVAEALPGRNAEYFTAVRESIVEIRDTRRAEQNRRIESERQAVEQATVAWTDKVRGAIAVGQLVAPEGESAVDYLAERSEDDELKQELGGELFSAIVATTQAHIGQGQLLEAESLVNGALAFATDNEELAELRISVEQFIIEAEESRVVPVSQLVRIEISPPRYPRRAEERGVVGWVEIAFTVTESGNTSDISIANAEPPDVFNESAVKAVSRWTFEPRVFRGRTITQRSVTRVVYQLD